MSWRWTRSWRAERIRLGIQLFCSELEKGFEIRILILGFSIDISSIYTSAQPTAQHDMPRDHEPSERAIWMPKALGPRLFNRARAAAALATVPSIKHGLPLFPVDRHLVSLNPWRVTRSEFTWMYLSACVPHAQAGRMSMDVSSLRTSIILPHPCL